MLLRVVTSIRNTDTSQPSKTLGQIKTVGSKYQIHGHSLIQLTVEWKATVAYPCTGLLLGHEKERSIDHATMWMNLEDMRAQGKKPITEDHVLHEVDNPGLTVL